MADHRAGQAETLREGETRIVTFDDGEEIGVIRHRDRLYAYRNTCPHQGGPACEGVLKPAVRQPIAADGGFLTRAVDEDEMHIVCPWHGYEFHLTTGANVCDPRLRLVGYEVDERDGEIHVRR